MCAHLELVEVVANKEAQKMCVVAELHFVCSLLKLADERLAHKRVAMVRGAAILCRRFKLLHIDQDVRKTIKPRKRRRAT